MAKGTKTGVRPGKVVVKVEVGYVLEEYWPVYELVSSDMGDSVLLDQELIERYEKAMDEFEAVQKELAEATARGTK